MLRQFEFAGSPREIGRQHGEALRDEIRTIVENRMELAMTVDGSQWRHPREACRTLAAKHLPYSEEYAPDLMEELRGIAEGSGVDLLDLLIMNGLTDFVDVVAREAAESLVGCTSFAATGRATRTGEVLVGQTWDIHASAEPRIVLLRLRPSSGPACLVFTIAGCIGVNGLNAAGLGIVTNDFDSTDGRPGVLWSFLIRRVLASVRIGDALDALMHCHRASGHNFIVADRHGEAFNVETSATRYSATYIPDAYGHANHYEAPELRPLDKKPLGRSLLRANRMSRLLREGYGKIDWEFLARLTQDHVNYPYAICRHEDPPRSALKTCGAVVMRPDAGDFWVAVGNPCSRPYEHVTLPLDPAPGPTTGRR